MRSKFLFTVIISGVFLWLAVRQVNPVEFTQALVAAQPGYVALAFLLTLMVCVVRALRWRLLLSPTRDIPLQQLFPVLMIGYLANNLLPARLGDVAMAFLIHRKEAVGKSRAMGTILLDRLLDASTLVGLLAICLLLAPLPAWVKRIALVGIILLGLMILLAWLTLTHKAACNRALRSLMQLLPEHLVERILQSFGMFIEGLAALQNPRMMLRTVLLSILIWFSLAGGVYLLFLAFHFKLDIQIAVIVLAIVNLGLIIPSSPGFIGTFQFFCVAALGLFAIDRSHALSFAVVYHLSQWVPTTLVGYYYLNKENLSLARLARINAWQKTGY